MSILTIIFIAISLSIDSFAVSVICGIKSIKIKILLLLKIALILSIFQAGFTALGWFFGYFLKDLISSFDHWLAFFILLLVGGKMIYDSFKDKDKKINNTNFLLLCGLGIATSIDAVAVGLSLSLLEANIYIITLIIGVITFIFSGSGILIGCKFGNKFSKAEIFGGIILIIIGIKILIEHL